MNYEIKRCRFSDIASSPNFEALSSAYAQESGLPVFGEKNVDTDSYEQINDEGTMECLGVFADSALVGFAFLMALEHFHYSSLVASVDAIFIAREHRKGALGLKLIAELKALARDHFGCDILSMTAPHGSRLSKLLSRIATPANDEFTFDLRGQNAF